MKSSVFLLALFLEIYQQSWKVDNEDVKIIDVLKICRNSVKAYIFSYLSISKKKKFVTIKI